MTQTRLPRRWDDRLDLVIVGALPIAGVVAYAIVRLVEEGGLHLAPGPVSAAVRDLLWFALIAGLASYATIEIANRVLRTRGRFQRWQTRRWTDARGAVWKDDQGAFAELLRAWRTPYRDSLRTFDLATEQLAAQIGAAVDVALSSPDRYPMLMACFRGERPESDPAGDSVARVANSTSDEFRLAQQVRVGVDQLQIVLADRWRRTVQGAAVWLAGLYGIAIARAQPTAVEPRHVLAAVLIGGPIAWLVHDLVALAEHRRQ